MAGSPNLAPSQDRADTLVADLVDLFLAEGFARFSVADLAARLRCSKTTLYQVAPSKEQIVVAVVRAYFNHAAERIERLVGSSADPADRVGAYLEGVATELQPASPTFYADLAGFAPADEVYRRNTAYAADRVRALVADGVAAGVLRPVDATFVGAATAEMMAAIQRGALAGTTGRDHATAYRQLADLVTHSLKPGDRPGTPT